MSLIERHGSDHQKRVAAFMRGAGQAVPDGVTVPDAETRRLRARLILEEALETITEGLGVLIKHSGEFPRVAMEHLTFEVRYPFSFEETADGVADLSVVAGGTLAACGLPDTPFIEEVDASNLRKLDGGYKDEHGKFRKPASWTPPDIAGVLARLQENET